MFNSPLIRLVAAIPIAFAVVWFLFAWFMPFVIAQNFEEPPERETRTLEAITPQEDAQEVRRTQRSKPQKLASANKPPPPPKLSSSKSDIDLPTPNIQGAAPQELNFDRMQSLAIDPVAISDRDAQPIRPPMPNYPRRAAERGTEGSCEVRFDVNPRGKPYNLSATCTDDIFKREAIRAVERVEFAPKIIRGKAAERKNVVYPLEFRLE